VKIKKKKKNLSSTTHPKNKTKATGYNKKQKIFHVVINIHRKSTNKKKNHLSDFIQ